MRAIALAGIPKQRRRVVTMAQQTISVGNEIELLLELLDADGRVTQWVDTGPERVVMGRLREGSIYLAEPVHMGAPTMTVYVRSYRLTIKSGLLNGAAVTHPFEGAVIIPPNTLTLAWPDNRALTLV